MHLPSCVAQDPPHLDEPYNTFEGHVNEKDHRLYTMTYRPEPSEKKFRQKNATSSNSRGTLYTYLYTLFFHLLFLTPSVLLKTPPVVIILRRVAQHQANRLYPWPLSHISNRGFQHEIGCTCSSLSLRASSLSRCCLQILSSCSWNRAIAEVRRSNILSVPSTPSTRSTTCRGTHRQLTANRLSIF